MPDIPLPKEVSGEDLAEVIRMISYITDFECYEHGNEITVGKRFPELVPEQLKHALDTTPSLELRFGIIDPKRNYACLPCDTMVGTMVMQSTDLEDERPEYRIFYDTFVESLAHFLR